MKTTFDPNDFSGRDIDRINAAIAAAVAAHGTTRISARHGETEPERRHWLIDSAILLPAGANVIVENCKIKLSDRCRDNFFRSANCGPDLHEPEDLRQIHLRGEGEAILEGADHPRATGDSAKQLGVHTYGTDAGIEGECQRGDWRNIGILLVRVRDFSVTGLTIIDSHCWAISLEFCSHGLLRDLTFHSRGWISVDGKEERARNQDGVDLRAGCHDILIDTIHGETGDDLIALTALRGQEPHRPGALGHTSITTTIGTPLSPDIHSIQIRTIAGYCALDGQIVRFLNTGGVRLHDITLDGLLDTSPADLHCHAAIRIGDDNPAWGGVTPLGDTSRLLLRSIHTNARQGVLIIGSLADSVISGIINRNPDASPVCYHSGPDHIRNVLVSDLVTLPPTV